MSALTKLALVVALCGCTREPPAPAPPPKACENLVWDTNTWNGRSQYKCPHDLHTLKLVGERLILCTCPEALA